MPSNSGASRLPSDLRKFFTRQQLYHWRKSGFFGGQERSNDNNTTGHIRYTFQEIDTLRRVKYLKESGVSTRKIKKCFFNLKERFPNIKHPFCGKPIFVFGGDVVYVDKGVGYDALTRQAYLLDFKEIKKWAGKVHKLKAKELCPEEELSLWIEKDLEQVDVSII